jgi:hypothetical protein
MRPPNGRTEATAYSCIQVVAYVNRIRVKHYEIASLVVDTAV